METVLVGTPCIFIHCWVSNELTAVITVTRKFPVNSTGWKGRFKHQLAIVAHTTARTHFEFSSRFGICVWKVSFSFLNHSMKILKCKVNGQIVLYCTVWKPEPSKDLQSIFNWTPSCLLQSFLGPNFNQNCLGCRKKTSCCILFLLRPIEML